MGILDPLTSLIISFCLLGLMFYKRVKLGIALCVTPVVLALLALDLDKLPEVFYMTANPLTQDGLIAFLVIIATFNIAWLSDLYRETGEAHVLSEGLSALIRRQKATLILVPALLGLLPVPGGVLLSAPMVETESKDLGLNPDKMAYINLWFRHIIFPLYPLGPSLIIVSALSGFPITAILLLQVPVVAMMVIIGYIMSLMKTPTPAGERVKNAKNVLGSMFLLSFLPILTAVSLTIILGSSENVILQRGLNVVVGSLVGLIVLILISRANYRTLIRPLLRSWLYDIVLATYGAFLFQNVIRATNVAGILKYLLGNDALGGLGLITALPLILSLLMGSSMGAIAIAGPIFSSFFAFSLKSTALLYASAYLGYIIAPTHLCSVFTVTYFKTTLARLYKYVIPSFMATYLTALLIYFLL